MDADEYQRIKEAEKEHLRALRKLKDAVRRLTQKQRVQQALDDMTTSAQRTLDEHEEQVKQLARETAHHEARLDEARASAEDDAQANADDAAAQQQRARALVRQLKWQMQVPESASPPDEPADDERDTSSSSESPEKTIGRMNP